MLLGSMDSECKTIAHEGITSDFLTVDSNKNDASPAKHEYNSHQDSYVCLSPSTLVAHLSNKSARLISTQPTQRSDRQNNLHLISILNVADLFNEELCIPYKEQCIVRHVHMLHSQDQPFIPDWGFTSLDRSCLSCHITMLDYDVQTRILPRKFPLTY